MPKANASTGTVRDRAKFRFFLSEVNGSAEAPSAAEPLTPRDLLPLRIGAILLAFAEGAAIFLGRESAGLPFLAASAAVALLSAAAVALAGLSRRRGVGGFLRFYLLFYALAVLADTAIKAQAPAGSEALALVSSALVVFGLFFVAATPASGIPEAILVPVGYLAALLLPPLLSEFSDGFAPRAVLTAAAILVYFAARELLCRSRGCSKKIGDLEEEALRAKYIDPTSGALSRAALDAYWRALAREKRVHAVGVLLIDVDDFKRLNRTENFRAGDEAVRRVREVIAGVLDADGLYLFRYEGGAFTVLIENPSDRDILRYAIAIRNAVAAASIARKNDWEHRSVTVTVGCAVEDIETDFRDDFLTNADRQLALGKSDQKNCVAFKSHLYKS